MLRRLIVAVSLVFLVMVPSAQAGGSLAIGDVCDGWSGIPMGYSGGIGSDTLAAGVTIGSALGGVGCAGDPDGDGLRQSFDVKVRVCLQRHRGGRWLTVKKTCKSAVNQVAELVSDSVRCVGSGTVYRGLVNWSIWDESGTTVAKGMEANWAYTC